MADVRIIPNRYQLHIVIWIHLAALTAMIANVDNADRDCSAIAGCRKRLFFGRQALFLDALGPRSGQAAHPTG